mmetsp:Transcript_110438/g.312367  ORF Transcript_110438/g.312367 Transcript_110438/m.312367 type:complete len:214 (-) Transcript_110438:23-664(-)
MSWLSSVLCRKASRFRCRVIWKSSYSLRRSSSSLFWATILSCSTSIRSNCDGGTCVMQLTNLSDSRGSFTSHTWDFSRSSVASLNTVCAVISFVFRCSTSIIVSSLSCQRGVPCRMLSFGSTPLPGSLFRACSFFSAFWRSLKSALYAFHAHGESSSFTCVSCVRRPLKVTFGSFGPPSSYFSSCIPPCASGGARRGACSGAAGVPVREGAPT